MGIVETTYQHLAKYIEENKVKHWWHIGHTIRNFIGNIIANTCGEPKKIFKFSPSHPKTKEFTKGLAHFNKGVLHPTHTTTITPTKISNVQSQHPTHVSKFHIQNLSTYEQN
jgi:hypothetical protein